MLHQLYKSIQQYLRDVGTTFAACWDRFWFTRLDPSTVSVLRILVGISATLYVASYTADLIVWLGPNGLLPVETVRHAVGDQPDFPPVYHWSYFNHVTDPATLWLLHTLSLLVTVCFACGIFSRISGLLCLCAVLSYLHRVPILNGLWEPVLTMLLLYLFWSPCGAKYSVDAWWRKRRADAGGGAPCRDSVAANISIRLIQLHLAGLYAVMAITKLASVTWWQGEAVWWLIAHSESRLVDLTGLHGSILLINLWTHGIVLFELCFAVLIWTRLARPILFACSIVAWLSIAMLTGELGFCATILIANLAFVPQLRNTSGKR